MRGGGGGASLPACVAGVPSSLRMPGGRGAGAYIAGAASSSPCVLAQERPPACGAGLCAVLWCWGHADDRVRRGVSSRLRRVSTGGWRGDEEHGRSLGLLPQRRVLAAFGNKRRRLFTRGWWAREAVLCCLAPTPVWVLLERARRAELKRAACLLLPPVLLARVVRVSVRVCLVVCLTLLEAAACALCFSCRVLCLPAASCSAPRASGRFICRACVSPRVRRERGSRDRCDIMQKEIRTLLCCTASRRVLGGPQVRACEVTWSERDGQQSKKASHTDAALCSRPAALQAPPAAGRGRRPPDSHRRGAAPPHHVPRGLQREPDRRRAPLPDAGVLLLLHAHTHADRAHCRPGASTRPTRRSGARAQKDALLFRRLCELGLGQPFTPVAPDVDTLCLAHSRDYVDRCGAQPPRAAQNGSLTSLTPTRRLYTCQLAAAASWMAASARPPCARLGCRGRLRWSAARSSVSRSLLKVRCRPA